MDKDTLLSALAAAVDGCRMIEGTYLQQGVLGSEECILKILRDTAGGPRAYSWGLTRARTVEGERRAAQRRESY